MTHSRAISDSQMDLLAERLAAIGVGRRDFLAGRRAAWPPSARLGFNARPGASARRSSGPARSSPRSRSSATAAAAGTQQRPLEPRLQQGPLLLGRARPLCAGLMKFNADFEAVPYVASKVHAEQGRLGVDVHDPQGLASGRTARRCTRPGLRVVVEAPARPASRRRPYASFLYDIKNGEAFNKKQIDGRRRGRREGQGRLDARGDARGPARLLPGARRLPGGAARPSRRRSRSTATSGRRPATSSPTGRSSSRRGSTTSRWCSGRTRTSSAPRTSRWTR